MRSAFEHGHVDLAQLVVEHGADAAHNDLGSTPLQ
jgi:hypothetical protein